MDQASHKGISAANPVHNGQNIMYGSGEELALLPKHTRPGVVTGRDRPTQGDGDGVERRKAPSKLFSNDAVLIRSNFPLKSFPRFTISLVIFFRHTVSDSW